MEMLFNEADLAMRALLHAARQQEPRKGFRRRMSLAAGEIGREISAGGFYKVSLRPERVEVIRRAAIQAAGYGMLDKSILKILGIQITRLPKGAEVCGRCDGHGCYPNEEWVAMVSCPQCGGKGYV